MRHIRTPLRQVGLLAACCLLLAACWQQVSLATTRRVPGTLPLPGVYRLGIGPIVGGDGMGLGDALTQAVLQTQAYAVFNGSAGAAGWRYSDVDAVVTGQISVQHVHEDFSYAPQTDAWGQVVGMVYSRTASAMLEVMLQVADADSGRVLGQVRLKHTAAEPEQMVQLAEVQVRDEASIATLFAPVDGYGLIALAQRAVAERFATQLTPSWQHAAVTLYTIERLPQSVWAQQAVEAGDWPQAISLYAQCIDALEMRRLGQSSDRAKVYYNLGVAYSYAGYFGAARQALQMAAHLDPSLPVQQARQELEAFAQEAQLQAGISMGSAGGDPYS